MALLSDGTKLTDIPDFLVDELAFDEKLRQRVQEAASTFLEFWTVKASN